MMRGVRGARQEVGGRGLRRVRSVRGLLAGALVAAGLLAPIAHAAPVGPGDVPCPDLTTGSSGVLAHALAPVSIPASLLSSYGAKQYAGVPQIGMLAFSVPTAQAAAFAAALRAVPGITAVEPDRVVTETRTPNDPLLKRQWALAKVRATTAWNSDIGVANPVTVAVLDTGVDAQHPDLLGRVLPGFDFVDGDSDASDQQFHGTAVASIIAANTNDRVGMAGVSWGAQVLPVRVLGTSGAGTDCTIIAGLVWSSDKAEVLNLSLGAAAPCGDLMQEAIDFADGNGALVVVSAGNDGAKGNPRVEPGDCSGVLTVAATDPLDRPAKFSEHGSQVAISAPGVNVVCAYRTSKGQRIWAYFSGTSMAAPMVSGVAALVWAKHPTWTAAQVRARLLASADDLGRRGRDDYFGAGRVDAATAVRN
jgi:subtilisin family serine protease